MECHRLAAIPGVIELVLVLDGERIEIHHEWLDARVLHRRDVLEHLDLLHRHHHHVHGVAALTDHLVVEEDIVHGEWDVVLGLEHDGVGKLLGADLRQGNALGDGLATGHRDHGGPALDPGLVQGLLHRLGHDPRLADSAVGDDVTGEGNSGKGFENEASSPLDELDHLDAAGPDIESERRLLLPQPEQPHSRLPCLVESETPAQIAVATLSEDA